VLFHREGGGAAEFLPHVGDDLPCQVVARRRRGDRLVKLLESPARAPLASGPHLRLERGLGCGASRGLAARRTPSPATGARRPGSPRGGGRLGSTASGGGKLGDVVHQIVWGRSPLVQGAWDGPRR